MKQTKIEDKHEDLYLVEGPLQDILDQMVKKIKPNQQYTMDGVYDHILNKGGFQAFQRLETGVHYTGYIIATGKPNQYKVSYITHKLLY